MNTRTNTNPHDVGKATLSAIAALMLTACAEDGSPLPDPDTVPITVEDEIADCPDVHIVNLSQDSRSGNSCLLEDGATTIADCVEESIRKDLPAACLASFDVFVPGTSSEHGAWKHFNQIPVRNGGRGYLSLQYQDDRFTSGWQNGDAAAYDQGVIDAADSLDTLLNTLKSRFDTEDVRIFGHSKGSHSVALVSERASFKNMDFFAFAQPGRTNVDISTRSDIGAGLLGNNGYIHKLSHNLIGATWQNDEVKFYKGLGKSGIPMPEKWGFPGYVWQEGNGTVNPLQMRIDHHSNYAGRYTDGLPGNSHEKGEGSTEPNKPYCATGSKSVWNSGEECDAAEVQFAPYLWGDIGCISKLTEMMENAEKGDTYYIGYSGPRANNCTEKRDLITVSYELEYKLFFGDQKDCRMNVEIEFIGIGGRPNAKKSIKFSSTTNTGWTHKSGTLQIPPHMRIDLSAELKRTDTDGFFRRSCGSAIPSRAGIRKLQVAYSHPDAANRDNPAEKTTITLIGNREGNSYTIRNLDMRNNVAWWKNDSGDKATWDLFYEPSVTGGFLEMRGVTGEDRNGTYSKWVHLLD